MPYLREVHTHEMEAMTRSFRKGITLKKRASMLRELGQNEAADALMDAVREIDTLKSRLANEPPIRLVWSQEKLEKEIYEQQIDQVAIKHHRGREMSKAQDQEWLKERWAGLRGDIETCASMDDFNDWFMCMESCVKRFGIIIEARDILANLEDQEKQSENFK